MTQREKQRGLVQPPQSPGGVGARRRVPLGGWATAQLKAAPSPGCCSRRRIFAAAVMAWPPLVLLLPLLLLEVPAAGRASPLEMRPEGAAACQVGAAARLAGPREPGLGLGGGGRAAPTLRPHGAGEGRVPDDADLGDTKSAPS